MALSISLARAAMDAARAVGPYLNSSFKRRHTVDFKTDFHDIVTEADTESQRILLASIFAAYPESLAVSEEAEGLLDISGSSRPLTDKDIVWYVDPIDGTSNFASGFDHWCVSIAAARGGELLAGAIYQPTRDLMFHADETGAYRNGEPISASSAELAQGIVGTEFPSPRVDDVEAAFRGFTHVLGSARSLRRTGSTALMLAEAAAGNFLATFNVGTKPWDVAAGAILVERAGGRFIGWGEEPSTGKDLRTASQAGPDIWPIYRRFAWTAPNFAAAGTAKAAHACLTAAGHPDPEAAVAAAWGENTASTRGESAEGR